MGSDIRYSHASTHLTIRSKPEMTWDKWTWVLDALWLGVAVIMHGFDFTVFEIQASGDEKVVIAIGSLRIGSEP